MPVTDSQKTYSYRDYAKWGEGVRCELIDGAVYDMPPAPSRRHQEVLIEILVQARNQLGREQPCRVYTAPFDVRLPERDEADDEIRTVVQPDIAVVCDPSKLDDKGCRGAPDWIVEIVSPASASTDHIKKLSLYENHGVKEYWIVHPVDRIVTVYRMNDQGRYGRPELYTVGDRVASGVVAGLEIQLDTVFELRDPAGK